MVDRSKALVTRGALERVLARAAELQGAHGDEGERDTLTEAQVEELAKEVGLSAQHVRQALAEERARIQPIAVSGSGLGFQLFGTDKVGAQRVVRGKPDRLLTTLDRWMQKDEALRVLRQKADIISWEPARGVFGSLRRILGTGDFALARADEITATVVPVDDEFTLVRLQASFVALRSAMGNRTALGTVVGSGASVAALTIGAAATLAIAPVVWIPVALAPAVLGSAGSYFAARRTQQHATQRALLSLEQLLDRLERGDAQPPSLLKMIESALPPSR
jgi:hypothetical protein